MPTRPNFELVIKLKAAKAMSSPLAQPAIKASADRRSSVRGARRRSKAERFWTSWGVAEDGAVLAQALAGSDRHIFFAGDGFQGLQTTGTDSRIDRVVALQSLEAVSNRAKALVVLNVQPTRSQQLFQLRHRIAGRLYPHYSRLVDQVNRNALVMKWYRERASVHRSTDRETYFKLSLASRVAEMQKWRC
jgi:hypothetical protein